MNAMKQTGNKPVNLSPLAAGTAYSIIWLAAGALIVSLLLHFTSMREAQLQETTMFVHGFAAMCGGLTAGKRTERRGWYSGLLLGVIYTLIVIIVSFLASNIALSGRSALLLGVALTTSALGGMIGVNLKRR